MCLGEEGQDTDVVLTHINGRPLSENEYFFAEKVTDFLYKSYSYRVVRKAGIMRPFSLFHLILCFPGSPEDIPH